MHKILVTGATGYIGSRLVDRLTGNPDYSIRIAIRRSINPFKNVESVSSDFFNDESLKKACAGIDVIIHLIALNEADSSEKPEEALRINTFLTLRLLKGAVEAGVKKFIYFSTAHIYGSPLAGIIDEKTLPRPVHPYAITHKAAEEFVNEENDKKRLSGFVLRLSNSYGYPVFPEMNRWSLVVNDLCRQAVTKKKLFLQTSGIQKRDFITLTDVCRTVEHLLRIKEHPAENNIFNLGGENSISIYEMAERISQSCSKLFSFTPLIERPNLIPGEISKELIYKIDKIKETGFYLSGNIDEEIEGTLMRCKSWFGDKNG